MASAKKILVADDNETLLMALEYSMQQAGYSVIKATDGEEAFDLARKENPDIVVSDITMPEMDGLELCEKIRSLPRLCDVPFIFLTAHGEPDERVKGLRLGADDYVVKPFDVEELITRIERIYQNIQKRNYSNTLSGNIRELSIPDTLQIFSQTKKKGNLIVRTEAGDGTISFCDGNLVATSFRELTGEDALVELLRLQTGHFYFEQQNVVPDPKAKPVNHVMLEAIRLIDERQNLDQFVPDFSAPLEVCGEFEEEDFDARTILDAFRQGASTGAEACKSSGLPRVRSEIALAILCREGVLRSRQVVEPVVALETTQTVPIPKDVDIPESAAGCGDGGPCFLMDTGGITNLFATLRESTPGLREVLLISDDGFPIVTTLEPGDEEGGMTSVGAILSASGQQGIGELRLGEMEAVITIGNQGYCVVSSIGRGTLLMTVASPEAQLGLLLFKLKRAVPSILKLMGLPASVDPDVP